MCHDCLICALTVLYGQQEEEDGEELLRSSAPILANKSARVPRAALDVERLKDANHADVSDAVIQVRC